MTLGRVGVSVAFKIMKDDPYFGAARRHIGRPAKKAGELVPGCFEVAGGLPGNFRVADVVSRM